MSPRSTLLAAIAECLARIQIADGFNTDAGDVVTLEPGPVNAEDSAAVVTVVWVRQERATEPQPRSKRLTTIAIEVKLPATVTTREDWIDKATADVERAMADQQFRFPEGYEFPKYQSAEPLFGPQAAAGWVGVRLTYTSHIPIN